MGNKVHIFAIVFCEWLAMLGINVHLSDIHHKRAVDIDFYVEAESITNFSLFSPSRPSSPHYPPPLPSLRSSQPVIHRLAMVENQYFETIFTYPEKAYI